MTAKGDLISNSDGTTPSAKPVGTLNQSLKADAGATLGLRWGTVVPTQTLLTTGSGATYTSPTYCIGILVEMVAPGGGGGGCAATTSTSWAGGAGGGAGAFVRKFIALSSPASFTYTITASGGAAGAAGNNPGSAGATAVFSGVGVTLICGPGGAGAGGAAITTANAYTAGTSINGGAPTGNYDIGFTGGFGGAGYALNSNPAGGEGGMCGPWSSAMKAFAIGAPSAAAGRTGFGYGGGGGGAQGASAAATVGGTGAPGLISIMEFY